MCSKRADLRSSLIQWFLKERRTLPWRPEDQHARRDPYAVWISEVMLQQTQVAVVLPRFVEWMECFPTISSLALAPIESVEELWSGLGYYARMRNLKKGATEILRYHQGSFPTDRKSLESISGIGPYSAGAILSLAFHQKEAVVDGNIFRIFCRFYGWDVPTGDPLKTKECWKIAREWVEHPTPWLINEALMELGALVCSPRKPNCERCPLRTECISYQEGASDRRPLPRLRTKTTIVERSWVLAPVDQHLYLLQPPGGDPHKLLSHSWLIPSFPSILKAEEIAEKIQIPLTSVTLSPQTVRHTITHHRITGVVALVSAPQKVKESFQNVEPMPLSLLRNSLSEKILAAAHLKKKPLKS